MVELMEDLVERVEDVVEGVEEEHLMLATRPSTAWRSAAERRVRRSAGPARAAAVVASRNLGKGSWGV